MSHSFLRDLFFFLSSSFSHFFSCVMSGLVKLTITVWGGKELKFVRTGDEKCDPVVELRLGSQKVKTKPTTMSATVSPVWNEKFVLSSV